MAAVQGTAVSRQSMLRCSAVNLRMGAACHRRYMDSKDDEQARGITMKSSSISLLFVPGAATRAGGPNSVPREERLDEGESA